MAFNFPNNPTTNQQVTGPTGIVYTFDGTKWLNPSQPNLYAPMNNPAFTGDPHAPTQAYGIADTSVATSAFVQRAVSASLDNVGRNILHNGLFNVQQRGAGAWTTTSAFMADRWMTSITTDTASYSVVALADADRAAIGDEAAVYALRCTFTGSATAGSSSAMTQAIESLRRLAGKTVTLSFWAMASAPLNLGMTLNQNYGTGGTTTPTVVNDLSVVALTTSWKRYTKTIKLPSAIGNTFGTNAGTDFTRLWFYYSVGSGTTVPSGLATQSGTITLWGMQLEFGSVATPLEKLDPVIERQLCLRFYQTIPTQINGGMAYAAGTNYWPVPLTTTMRATPSVVFGTITYGNSSGLAVWSVTGNVLILSQAIAAAGQYYAYAPVNLSADL